MFWFPREESTGNRHVWLYYDLEVLKFTSMMVERMWWEICSLLGWIFTRRSWCDQVEQGLFCSWSRWPFTVKGDWGRCLQIIPVDRSGHDVK